MSLENAIRAKSNQYATMRAGLRAKARRWVDERTPASATNARRQLNQAFDAGVSATIEMLRELEPLNLTAAEIETIEGLRAGKIGVIGLPSRSGSAPTVASGVRSPYEAPTPSGEVRGGSYARRPESEREIIESFPSIEECAAEQAEAEAPWEPVLAMKCVDVRYPERGSGSIVWVSMKGDRVKLRYNTLDRTEDVWSRDLREVK